MSWGVLLIKRFSFVYMSHFIKSLVIVMLCGFIRCDFSSAQGIDALFSSAPKEVLPLLDRTSRLDMLDLYNGGLEAKTENIYGGQSEMLRKTHDYIKVRCSESSFWQMKLLPVGHDTLIVCVHTLLVPEAVSTISFYRHDWHLQKREMPRADFSQFVQTNSDLSSYRKQALMEQMRVQNYQASLNDSTTDLTISLDLSSLQVSDREDAQRLFHPVAYKWVGGKYVIPTAHPLVEKVSNGASDVKPHVVR